MNCAWLVGGFSVLFTAMGYGYTIHINRKHIKLEKKDKEHEAKHQHNENRIKELEKKNGAEQKQIDELKEELKETKKDKSELKDMVIKLQDRIINCEKNNGKNKQK